MRQPVMSSRVPSCAIQPVDPSGRPGSITCSHRAPPRPLECPITGSVVCSPDRSIGENERNLRRPDSGLPVNSVCGEQHRELLSRLHTRWAPSGSHRADRDAEQAIRGESEEQPAPDPARARNRAHRAERGTKRWDDGGQHEVANSRLDARFRPTAGSRWKQRRVAYLPRAV